MKVSLRYLVAVIVLSLLSAACSKKHEETKAQVRPLSGEPMGEALFRERCRDCHKINKTVGEVGPDLANPKKKRTARFLERVLREPAKVFPGTVMPPYRDLSVRQVNSLIDFVSGLH